MIVIVFLGYKCYKLLVFTIGKFWENTLHTSPAESQKGINAVLRCSIKNQKDAFAIDFVQQ